MNTMRTIVKRHPLVTFFVLTYLLSWLPWLFGGNNFAFGPLIASLIVAALSGGRAELRAWWQAVTRWRGGLGELPLAIPHAHARRDARLDLDRRMVVRRLEKGPLGPGKHRHRVKGMHEIHTIACAGIFTRADGDRERNLPEAHASGRFRSLSPSA